MFVYAVGVRDRFFAQDKESRNRPSSVTKSVFLAMEETSFLAVFKTNFLL